MKPEQERVRHLLSDTVTLLCKNGLQFQDELRVEGVIGITLDNNEVFVVHINEAFGEGGVQKPPPKNIGSGSIGATTLTDLPGLVSEQHVRPRIQSRGIIRGRGLTRGRPFGATMRRGAFNSRRMPMGRQIMGGSRGRGMPVNCSQPNMNQLQPVIPMSSSAESQPPQKIASPPPHIVKTDDVVFTEINASVPSIHVKQEPESPRNGQCSDNIDSSKNRNSFVNLSLGDVTAENLPFFDPLNDNEDNLPFEPPAKRSHTDSEPNLMSPLDSIMNVVSNNASDMTSHQSALHMSSSNQQNMLPEIKQESPLSFPPSLQPMGGPSEWQMNSLINSPQKSPHGIGPASGSTADTVSVNFII